MTSYEMTTRIKVGGVAYPARTRFCDGDRVADALGSKDVARLIQQGYLRVLGLPDGLEPGYPQNQLLPPLPSGVRYDASGQRIDFVEHGPKVTDLRPPASDLGQSVTSVPPPAPLGRPEAQPLGRWRSDPERLAGLDIDTLNGLILDVDPDGPTFEVGEEEDARRLLSSDFDQPVEGGGDGVQASGSVVEGTGDDGADVRTVRQKGSRRVPAVKPGR
jgi:hypothetical protein